jgi:Mg-chelatase subunit ChlD
MNHTQYSIVPGSIGALAKQTGKSIAESFVNADCIVVVDTSGSMGSHDSRGNQSRYDVAIEELAALQNSLPGKIAVVSFSNHPEFCPSGVPINFGGGTDLAGALRFVKIADVEGIRFIVISDGMPDSPDRALEVARTFRNRIDVIYVGPEDYPTGREFLERLAAISGGVTVTADRAKELAPAVTLLLKG